MYSAILFRMYKRFIKRLLDIVVATAIMPLCAITFLIVAPIIFLTDKGPVFYNAARLGRCGKTFTMYKFRSMKVDATDLRNDDGSAYNAQNDPRVTRIGTILRKTSIDELPQIVNVLKGDMSLVGPRPNLVTVPYEDLSDTEKRGFP